MGLLLASATGVRAEERAKQHRIAIVIGAGPVAFISETSRDGLSRRLYSRFSRNCASWAMSKGQISRSSAIPEIGGPGAFPISLARSPAAIRR
jgi:hypothetical protein